MTAAATSWSRAAVLRKVAAHFQVDEAGEVLALLDTYESSSEDPPHRVHLAVLKLSNGDIDAIRRYVALAMVDFRDVLASAEYPTQLRLGANAEPEERREAEVADRKQYRRWLES